MKTLKKLHAQGRELKTQQAACHCGAIDLELDAKCQDCVHSFDNDCQVDKIIDLTCLSERFYPPGEPGTFQYCQFFLCHRCEVDRETEIKVTGYSYGFDEQNKIVWKGNIEDLRHIAEEIEPWVNIYAQMLIRIADDIEDYFNLK